jgi:hypothetical protein
MSGRAKTPALHPAEDVYWAVEQGFTLVVKERRREAFRLAGLEQVVWDCLEMGYTLEQAGQTVAAAGKISPEAARVEIQAILQEWQTLGLVQREEPKRG